MQEERESCYSKRRCCGRQKLIVMGCIMKSLKLITEVSRDFEILEEGTGKEKDLYVVGIFSSADLKNANGRIYKKNTLDREVKRIQEEHFKTGVPLFGQLNHPAGPESDLEKVAIRTVALEWKGSHLYGKAKVLRDTPSGAIAAALLKEAKLGISSRCLGQVAEDGYVVDESYKLLTWDLVNNASNTPSWVNGILENFELSIESEEDLLIEVEKERIQHCKRIFKFLDTLKS